MSETTQVEQSPVKAKEAVVFTKVNRLQEVLKREYVPELVNRKSCTTEVQEEKPEHRIMCLLKAEGYSAKEIAEKTGYSAHHVSTILNQSWAKKLILETIHLNSQEGIERMYKQFEAEALAMAHDLLIEQAGEGLKAKDKLTSCFEILKIARGTKIVLEDNRRSLDEIQNEEAAVTARLDALTGSSTN